MFACACFSAPRPQATAPLARATADVPVPDVVHAGEGVYELRDDHCGRVRDGVLLRVRVRDRGSRRALELEVTFEFLSKQVQKTA